MKRALRLNGLDKELEIAKAVIIDTSKEMFLVEKMNNGKYRLTVSKSLIDDLSKFESLEMVREEGM